MAQIRSCKRRSDSLASQLPNHRRRRFPTQPVVPRLLAGASGAIVRRRMTGQLVTDPSPDPADA